MADTAEEREWIRRCQQGDTEAFERLVNRHQRMIHALTYRMTGSLSDAEDLAQETFIRAYRQIASFRGEASFATWLYRIAINTCLNWGEGARRRQALDEEWAKEPRERTPVDELAARVHEALLRLDPKQRAAVVLTTYDGLNHAEAARVLGCSRPPSRGGSSWRGTNSEGCWQT